MSHLKLEAANDGFYLIRINDTREHVATIVQDEKGLRASYLVKDGYSQKVVPIKVYQKDTITSLFEQLKMAFARGVIRSLKHGD